MQIEAEGSYDFARSFESQISFNNGVNVQYQRPQLRTLHGLIGPKFNLTSSSGFLPYITVKGGIVNFSAAATFQTRSITTQTETPTPWFTLQLGWSCSQGR